MEKIIWTDLISHEILHTVKDEGNVLHTIKIRKANWIGHILRRNCLLKHVIEGKIGGNDKSDGKTRKRTKQLLDDVREEKKYWKLKEKMTLEEAVNLS
jgi:hypothetical protein